MTATLGAISPAAAQDNPSETSGAPVPAVSRRADYANACAARDGLSLCVDPVRRIRIKAKQAKKNDEGALSGFTRLAGMFMGRVDAADLGPFRFRFELELR